MDQPLEFVGETDYPRLYQSQPFKAIVRVGLVAQPAEVRTVIQVVNNVSLRGIAVGHVLADTPQHPCIIGMETGMFNIVNSYMAACLVHGLPEINLSLLYEVSHALRELTDEDIARIQLSGSLLKHHGEEGATRIANNSIPPCLDRAALLLYSEDYAYGRKTVQSLVNNRKLEYTDLLGQAGIQDPQEVCRIERRKQELLQPYSGLIQLMMLEFRLGLNIDRQQRKLERYVLQCLCRCIRDPLLIAALLHRYAFDRFDPTDDPRTSFDKSQECIRKAAEFALRTVDLDQQRPVEDIIADLLSAWHRWKRMPRMNVTLLCQQ